MSHLRTALYGSIAIERGICPGCEESALILQGKVACGCDLPADRTVAAAIQYERMIESGYKRVLPPKWVRDALLEDQQNRCFYCGSCFGDVAINEARRTGPKEKILKVEWDHVEPFNWTGNNHHLNFVASCQVCNSIKRGLYFATKEDARAYVWRRRQKKGWQSATEIRPGQQAVTA